MCVQTKCVRHYDDIEVYVLVWNVFSSSSSIVDMNNNKKKNFVFYV